MLLQRNVNWSTILEAYHKVEIALSCLRYCFISFHVEGIQLELLHLQDTLDNLRSVRLSISMGYHQPPPFFFKSLKPFSSLGKL